MSDHELPSIPNEIPQANTESLAVSVSSELIPYGEDTIPSTQSTLLEKDTYILEKREKSLDFLRSRYVSNVATRSNVLSRLPSSKLAKMKDSYEVGLRQAGEAAFVVLQKQDYTSKEIEQLAALGREIENSRLNSSIQEVTEQVGAYRTKRNDEIFGRNKPEKYLMPGLESTTILDKFLPDIHDRYPMLTRAEISEQRRRSLKIAAAIGILMAGELFFS